MLRYTGGGCGGSLPGIPARDLKDKEAEALGGQEWLVSTGLFEVFEPPRKREQKEEKKEQVPSGE